MSLTSKCIVLLMSEGAKVKSLSIAASISSAAIPPERLDQVALSFQAEAMRCTSTGSTVALAV